MGLAWQADDQDADMEAGVGEGSTFIVRGGGGHFTGHSAHPDKSGIGIVMWFVLYLVWVSFSAN